MTCARSEVVREGEIGVYHCVHRCVRRAFLCGEDEWTGRSFEHRRGWIRDRLKELTSVFAIEVGGFSVMANHVHAVLRTRPDLAAGFSAEEMASRWWRLFPGRDGYLDLLDWTGRAVASGKRGRIPAHLAPILDRLQIDVDRWIDTVTRFGRWFHRAAWSAQALCAEAARVARRWLRGVGAARLAFCTS